MIVRRKFILWLAAAVAILAIGFGAWCARFVSHLTHPPHRPVGAVPAELTFPVEPVRFKADDGVSLSGWFLPCPGATRAVVLLHGGQRNRLAMVPHAQLLRKQGYAVLLYDTRGHGESDDAPSARTWRIDDDLVGALDYLRGRGFREFGLLGLSQGGINIALTAGRLRDLCWVVLECTPADVRDIIRHDIAHALPVPEWLAGAVAVPMLRRAMGASSNDFVLRDQVAKFRCPVLVIAGGADIRVLPAEARDLFDHVTAPKSFWLIPGAPHTNFYLYIRSIKEEYEQRVTGFITEAVKKTNTG